MPPPLRFANRSELLSPNPPTRTYGAVVVDLLGEPRPQIVCVTVNGPNFLYRWDEGEGCFRESAPPALADPGCSGIGVACADADGDGRLDVYLLNTSRFLGPDSDPDRLLLNRGGLRFEDALADNLDCNTAAGRSVCWIDALGDEGYLAYVANYGVANRLLGRPRDGRFFRDFAPQFGLDRVTGGRGLVAAPIFGGPRVDLYAVNENGPNLLFRNLGGGQFEEVARAAGVADPNGHGRGVVAADAWHDGRLGLIYGNWEGRHHWFRQVELGRFSDVATAEFARSSRVRTVIAADFDNDGWEEIFFNHLGEPNRLFRRDPETGRWVLDTPAELALAEGYGTGASVGDLNGDGFLDLFISHGESAAQPNVLLFSVPNGNHWLRVIPLTRAGAPAVGARVMVVAAATGAREGEGEGERKEAAGTTQTRVIDGGSGYLCQMEPVAHFGLGPAGGPVERVEVTWPTGARETLRGVGVDQVLRVPHPA